MSELISISFRSRLTTMSLLLQLRTRPQQAEVTHCSCQDNHVCLQGGPVVLPEVEGVAAAQQSLCHPRQEARDAQGLHGNPKFV